MSGAGLPILKPGELIRALERMGFRLARKSKSGHQRYAHPDGRWTTVPVHKGRDIGPGLLRKILRDIELDPDELHDWL